ncbi:chromosomal replication initiator protein DnaA [Candidatus Daviesbacteria bacterium]|nr:chromosomal replication initiator protein DnaA [Candidatus Daviesbacteria bacterium]
MDTQKIWQEILAIIKPQISPINYRGWFLKASLDKLTDKKALICVPTAFFAEQLKARYFDLIQDAFLKITGKNPQLEFKVDSSKLSEKAPTLEENLFDFSQPPPTNWRTSSNLNPKYTMGNFMVGFSNNVAFAAAQAVVQNPGLSYNPLFIYGGTGVGKTHLMLGIGNALVQKNTHPQVIYCSSEKFMNDYVEAIQNHKMGELRTRYRLANVLLIDDIQFFSGREGTQEEFFHTFNELQTKNAQIVLTSDRPPQEIGKLEDRLKSRFAGGLMVDIQPPDFDTRVAILQAKCREKGETLSEEALRLIASSVDSNIRELEGRLAQILQVLKTQNLAPTTDNILLFLNQPTKTTLKTDHKKIMQAVCDYFNLNSRDLTGPKRNKELVLPRHIVMYILSEELNLTVEKIGQIVGGRDHTTVMHGRDRIKKLAITDREVQRTLIEVKQKIQSYSLKS